MRKSARRLKLAEIRAELARVGKVGEIFVDGDLCREAWRPHAETFMRGDDMDYNPAAVVPLKKTLLRLERVCEFPCGAALWRRRPDIPESGEPLLYGSHSSPDGGGKPANRGYVPPAMTPEMKKVFLKGERAWKIDPRHDGIATFFSRGLRVAAEGMKRSAVIQLFVPVKDSMGEIAAALEVFTAAAAE